MTAHATDRLVRAIRGKRAPIALGLDTRPAYLPDACEPGGEAAAVLAFNTALLDAVADVVPCVKVQSACYEAMGAAGVSCMAATIRAARERELVVIADAKRGDIGSTAEAYSAAFLAEGAPLRSDFLTVNPYFGTDGITPFTDDCRRAGAGIFALVKTSNPSGRELQDIVTDDGRPLYERVAERVAEWGGSLVGDEGWSAVGAVVGATYPEQGAALRRLLPRTFFLVPGYGAQGATARDLAGCFDARGEGAVVNASRSILLAYRRSGGHFADAARAEAVRMRDDLRAALECRKSA